MYCEISDEPIARDALLQSLKSERPAEQAFLFEEARSLDRYRFFFAVFFFAAFFLTTFFFTTFFFAAFFFAAIYVSSNGEHDQS